MTWPVVRMWPGSKDSVRVKINDGLVRSVCGAMASSKHHPKQECRYIYPTHTQKKSFYKLEDFAEMTCLKASCSISQNKLKPSFIMPMLKETY